MTEDVRKKPILPSEPDHQLTTADLAGTSQKSAKSDSVRPVDVEPLSDAKLRSSDHAGNPGNVVAGDTGKRGTQPASQAAGTAPAREHETGPLFSSSEANDLRAKWDAIQVGFVDEPRRAVEQADNLVAGTMKRLA